MTINISDINMKNCKTTESWNLNGKKNNCMDTSSDKLLKRKSINTSLRYEKEMNVLIIVGA